MKRRHIVGLTIVGIVALGALVLFWYVSTADSRDPLRDAFNERCAGCHGVDLEGGEIGVPLIGPMFARADGIESTVSSILSSRAHSNLFAGSAELSPKLMKGLAIYISEQALGYPTVPESYRLIPQDGDIYTTELYRIAAHRLSELSSRPYSIEPLPDGRVLVAEKTRGLSIVSQDGVQGALITGTPRVWNRLVSVRGIWVNWGALLDVELHPDYVNNGWIYLSFTDRCQWDCGWPIPVSMVKVVRGRISRGQWTDEEAIWTVDRKYYTPVPDGVAGGRLAFDNQGHLYISVGGKNTYSKLHDLNTPYGKIHRVTDDGAIPPDNPFLVGDEELEAGSSIRTVFSYGHRTIQGLEGHSENGTIWNTEMGPRGGDEVNLIRAGKNYGWPLYTNGLDYDGDRIRIGEKLGLSFRLEDTESPLVDWTPAPAISNLTHYHGTLFPQWRGDLLVGSLKAGDVYRVRVSGDSVISRERLLKGFGRVRDLEVAADGSLYIALEHDAAGSVWRLKPAP